ncbi:MAG: NADH:ubiquinone reductase (Na(+)-transporting) subunit F [Bacteroidaceae bacterium]|nr:NADH:ubiquinone reductase (Na(+)-transporting) subunit F [Candidatus Colenecus caballi]MCQ2072284.1 NADH:ubiquinone reductase (Na(+)-transporting) subunit F [Bacteroidaceae bacterium]
MNNLYISSIVVFLAVILLLVVILLVAKRYLVASGKVKITMNGDKELEVNSGASLLSTLAENGVYLPSACGGKGSCGQCKCQVVEGGGEILDSEKGHFSRKQIKDNWRLGCQCKVKGDLSIKVSDSVLGVKEWECEVISNRNVATFIKEFKVKLPAGEHMDFLPGSYAQIKIPTYDIKYADYDRSLIGDLYIPAWEKFGLFDLKQKNDEPTIRAYSMANYPDEGDIITLTVRIATPPFKPKPEVGFQDVPCGIASTYIFNLKPGDKVTMSGPYGEFHPRFDSKKEMIWVGGGAGMAPLRAQIMHMLKTLHTRDREMHYFYGARAIDEVFFMDDFLALEKEYPNFHFHLALDRPDPKADAMGVKYTAGFIAPVLGDTYLKQHEAPEDIEYYLCGPPMMAKTVIDLLDSLGVESKDIMFDNFGA